ncbi:hypothetical protein AArcSl_1298 [Halalkaliarchaeum desulfuricum]|uniref:Uncharacterized protein n=1 Tax=Halalkaliarchaeum desulfuricum TaxID=2055893 RepID=A0A343TIK7_9EURY|nr:hypothetical protein [Halalkaliarchaeum desulfuricum]AUX08929.1 hypothetical protein AArcSl_1298 [Halalkaliarchaeum desulfuricum]
MTTKQPINELELNAYEVTVPLDLSVFDSYDEVELTLVETVARSIVDDVDELNEDDTSYVTSQVMFDEDGLEEAYEDDDVGIATVQTVTELAVLEEDDD